jgi:hypothetical protein
MGQTCGAASFLVPSQGACVPFNQTVSGTLTLDVLVQLHNQDDRELPALTSVCTIDSGKLPLGSITGINLDCRNNLKACKVGGVVLTRTRVSRVCGLF